MTAGGITEQIIPVGKLIKLVQPRFYRIVCHRTAEQQLKQLVAVAVGQFDRHAENHTHAAEVGSKLRRMGRIGENRLQSMDAFAVIRLKRARIRHKITLIC